MDTTNPARNNITAAHHFTNREFAQSLTEYAAIRWFDPVSFDWSDPDYRWLDLVNYARPACERCGQQFYREWPRHRQRFCSPRCRRSAARLREMAARQQQPTGDPATVLADCQAALAACSAIVAEEASR